MLHTPDFLGECNFGTQLQHTCSQTLELGQLVLIFFFSEIHNRHLTVKSRCWYFNEKSSDVFIYDYQKLKVIKRINCKIAILHHNITISHHHNITISKYWYCNIVISISILWYCDIVILRYCDIVMQYCYLII